MTDPLVQRLLDEVAFLRRLVEQLAGGTEPADTRLGTASVPGPASDGSEDRRGTPPYSPTRTRRVRQVPIIDPEELARIDAATAEWRARKDAADRVDDDARPAEAITEVDASP